MPRSTYISAGSTTRIKSGAGTLYLAHVSPANGSSLVLADTPNLGAAGPNFNLRTSVTSTIAFVGTYASAVPDSLDFNGTAFDNGLSVSATSSAAITVVWD